MARRKHKRKHYGATREEHEAPARDLFHAAEEQADRVKALASGKYGSEGCSDSFMALLSGERVFGKATAHQHEAEINFDLEEIRQRKSHARTALNRAAVAVLACLRKG